MKKIIIIVSSLVLIQNFLFAAEPLRKEALQMAPDFTLLDLENKEFSLSSLKGKPVILFFWTTWCPHCQKELKLLNTTHAELLKNGVELVTINVEEPADKIRRFMGTYSLSFRVLLDIDLKASQAYEVIGVPTYFLINKEGRIVFNNHYFPHEEYKELISK